MGLYKTGWWCNNHLEKYEFVNGKDYPIYEMENKKCSKPPTRKYRYLTFSVMKINGESENRYIFMTVH